MNLIIDELRCLTFYYITQLNYIQKSFNNKFSLKSVIYIKIVLKKIAVIILILYNMLLFLNFNDLKLVYLLIKKELE